MKKFYNARYITDVEFENVFSWDAPEYCDAYVSSCLIENEPATDEQLDDINNNADLVHELLMRDKF